MIELLGVARTFEVGGESVHALREIRLQVASGDYVAVMGPSGSGKSTLLNILGLLDRPSRGTYRLENVDATALSDREQAALRLHRIGFVFQFFHLIPRLSAYQNVELPMILAGMEPSRRRQRVIEALTQLGLGDRMHHRPNQLSGGQRQRVAIARATIMQPRIILADEPTGNLDREAGREVIAILEHLNAGGITVILVTHDPELGARATRRIRMIDGRVAEDGT